MDVFKYLFPDPVVFTSLSTPVLQEVTEEQIVIRLQLSFNILPIHVDHYNFSLKYTANDSDDYLEKDIMTIGYYFNERMVYLAIPNPECNILYHYHITPLRQHRGVIDEISTEKKNMSFKFICSGNV